MNKKSLFFTSILCLFCSVAGYSTPLEDAIESYQDVVKKAHKSADVDALKNVNERFRDLGFEEKEWKNFADKNNIFKWSSQDEHQRVGGWLFYPREFDETQVEVSGEKKVVPWGFLDNPYQIRFTERIDYIWALTIASQYKHPVAQYYLCQAMIQALVTQEQLLDKDRKDQYTHPSFNSLKKFYGQCLEHLRKDVGSNQKAELNRDPEDIITYLPLFRWDNSELDLVMDLIEGKSPDFDTIREAARKLAKLSFRSQLRRLEAKKNYAKKELATQQSFLQLGKNYAPAYKSLIDNFKNADDYDHEKSEGYLDKAITLGHIPSYIDRGHLYIIQGKYDKRTGNQQSGEDRIIEGLQQFQIAAENGLSQGYIEQGTQLLGINPVVLTTIKQVLSKKDLEKDDFSKIEKALNFFKKAADQKDPQGYYLNAHLNRKMSEYYTAIKDPSKQQKYKEDCEESLKNAAKLGLTRAYFELKNYLDKKKFEEIKQTHPPLYNGLWEQLMGYIKADNREGTLSNVSTGRGRGREVSRIHTKQGRSQV